MQSNVRYRRNHIFIMPICPIVFYTHYIRDSVFAVLFKFPKHVIALLKIHLQYVSLVTAPPI
jgi:hypothetical protein